MATSLKSCLIDSYKTITHVDKFDLNQNSLILLTSIGTIYGKEFKFDETNVENAVINEINKFAEKEYFNENKDIQGNDEYIALEDVLIVTPRGDQVKFKYLNVFYDQIIGVTVGNFTPDIETEQI